jgi:hypothetical protein
MSSISLAFYKIGLHVWRNSTNLDIKIYGFFFIDVGKWWNVTLINVEDSEFASCNFQAQIINVGIMLYEKFITTSKSIFNEFSTPFACASEHNCL